jgi:hypothetical protein
VDLLRVELELLESETQDQRAATAAGKESRL